MRAKVIADFDGYDAEARKNRKYRAGETIEGEIAIAAIDNGFAEPVGTGVAGRIIGAVTAALSPGEAGKAAGGKADAKPKPKGRGKAGEAGAGDEAEQEPGPDEAE